MIAIKTEDLTYTYSPGTPFEKTAVDHVNLEIEQGEFVGVIGHTGSGKSTLIQHFNGLLRPTSGRVLIEGTDLWAKETNLREYRFKVGLVFQYPEYQLFEETVYKDIAFGPQNMGLSPGQVDERVREAARFVGLKPHHMEKSPFELSGGQKRRVAIAGVLAMNPDILVLDEPTAGLDPKGRERILGQIKQYHKERGSTVLLVSHSMEDIAKYAHKVLVLSRAGVVMYDDVAKVFSRAKEITDIGLSVPQVTRIFDKLREKGYPVDESVYTMDFAKNEILRLLGKGDGADA
ncbi:MULTISPECIES: energy-coupling factor transporter ATPase [Anaerotruncus]|jgi:energy-coupling factor transport system ATP-binding protein|uniref:energy-coupling factor transporter ATPase n=2 Tax=Oscillospiraceae TaxID=216572 RepID=UPI000832D8EC|nr:MULTISPECIES: energy-coupling factor transporter ATPase [Anaerotruncus]RGX54903.1 energy-coupling factor transporter ATPase [Anaerotruncus sp. AF02-27]